MALAPLLPAAAVAVGTLKVDAALPYVCTLPSGPQPATVRITAAFPERAEAGEEIRPADVTTTVEFPGAAVAELTALKAATVRAESRLAVGVAQGEQRAEATWSGTAQPVAVPAEGPLTLTTTGDVSSLTTGTEGELSLTAGAFGVDLALSTAEGAATVPASLSVACAPAPDAEGRTVFARVPVGAGAPTGGPGTAAPSPDASSPSSPVPGLPLPPLPSDPAAPGDTAGTATEDPGAGPRADEGLKAADEDTPGAPAPRPAAPPCVTKDPTPMSLSAYITGYSNVRKQDGASLIPLTCVLMEQGDPEIVFGGTEEEPETHLINKAVGRLSTQGRQETPPFKGTFLTFGFAPTTATLVLEQAGPMALYSDTLLSYPYNISETYVRVPLVLRVLDARVNGTKLDVGPSCRTEKPLSSTEPDPATYPGDHMVLVGKGLSTFGGDAKGYLLTGGGPLVGKVTIPAFKGCGAKGENLDRLLTASISGSDNYVRQIQGQTCNILNPFPPINPECTDDGQPYQVPRAER
ncbi:DUF6801 domain-containing protein [Streptomyces termitum]|uniref:DUF6801 domain-containing protein n=1 Tax=Streptomyces termitum TaxID=67368 RepID=UPI0027E41AE4|nr:DUF6801 domain-containing protein [Streptomyces termitum]